MRTWGCRVSRRAEQRTRLPVYSGPEAESGWLPARERPASRRPGRARASGPEASRPDPRPEPPRGCAHLAVWTPPLDEPIELRDRAEYEERFRALFTDAVRCRLRTIGPVGSELSGGLDSTSVAAMATRLLETDAAPADRLLTFSCMFPWSRRADEGGHIQQAVRELGLDWTEVVNDGARSRWVWDDSRFWSDIPLPADGPDHVDLCRAARDRGCSVVLTGLGGDQSFDPSGEVLLDLVQDRRLLTAWRVAMGWAGDNRRDALGQLLRMGLAPHRPPWMPRPGARPRAPEVSGAARAEAEIDARRAPGRKPRVFRRLRAQRDFETFISSG